VQTSEEKLLRVSIDLVGSMEYATILIKEGRVSEAAEVLEYSKDKARAVLQRIESNMNRAAKGGGFYFLRKAIIGYFRRQGIKITPQSGEYLFAIGPENIGYFIRTGNVDAATYEGIRAEAKRAGIQPPYHVYGDAEVYQDRETVVFHKLNESLREMRKNDERFEIIV